MRSLRPSNSARAARFVGAALFALVPFSAGAASLPVVDGAQVSSLPGGGTAIVRRSAGAPVAAIELWFRLPSTGFDAVPRPGIARLAAYAVAASTPITGTSLSALVARVGGRFTITVNPDAVSIAALVPKTAAASVVRTMTAVYFSPVVDEAGLARAVTLLASDARLRAIAEPEEGVRDALFAQLFASDARHYSTELSAGAGPALDGGLVRAVARRGFRPSNALLVLAGDVDPALIAEAVDGPAPVAQIGPSGELPLIGGGLSKNSNESSASVKPAPALRLSLPAFGYGWTGPPISDEAAATALDFIADYLFSDTYGIVTARLRGADVAVIGQYITYRDPGVFIAIGVGKDIARGRAAVDEALATLSTGLDPAAFAAGKARFLRRLVADVQEPLGLADTLGWYATEGNANYAPGTDLDRGRYARAAADLTPTNVAAAARTYLSDSRAVVNAAGSRP